MSKGNRCGDSTSSTFTNDDIEAIVSKAVEAAVQVLKTEFTKLFEDINSSIKKIEDSLADYISDTRINDRISALESVLHTLGNSQSNSAVNDNPGEIDELRRESREAKMIANDNEQYCRRLNIRIKGLRIASGDNGKQIMAKFFRERLKLPIDSGDIEAAYQVTPRRQPSSVIRSNTDVSSQPGSQSRPQTESSVLVRFCRSECRDQVIRQRRLLKGSGVTIHEDLTNLNIQTLNRARNNALVDKTWTWNGRIYALLRSGKKIMMKPYVTIDDCPEVWILTTARKFEFAWFLFFVCLHHINFIMTVCQMHLNDHTQSMYDVRPNAGTDLYRLYSYIYFVFAS